jgi:hypothetical protein
VEAASRKTAPSGLRSNRQKLRGFHLGHTLRRVCCRTILFPQTAVAFPVDFGQGFVTHRVIVAGNVISLTVGGHGPVVVLLHGYAEDSRM